MDWICVSLEIKTVDQISMYVWKLCLLQDRAFGAAGETVVVEELLEGEEVSVS